MAIFIELKIADFPGLCVASLSANGVILLYSTRLINFIVVYKGAGSTGRSKTCFQSACGFS